MKMKPSDLIGRPLDYAVSVAHGDAGLVPVEYSTRWEFGGPIIEQHLIDLMSCDGGDFWRANIYLPDESSEQNGPTPLIAAMRCYVASKVGLEIDIPEDLA